MKPKSCLRAMPLLLACCLAAAASPASAASLPEIPFEKFVLPNGLTVIVHEDHKAPIVAVNVWYHVGSRTRSAARPASRTSSST